MDDQEQSEETIQEFIAWVKEEQNKRRWTQTIMAQKGGISQQAISQMFHGHNNPSEKMCVALAKAFNLPVYDVLQRAGLRDEPLNHKHPLNKLMLIAQQLDGEDLDRVIDLAQRLAQSKI